MLKKRDDIKRVFSSDKNYYKSILVRYNQNGLDFSRFLIVPEKKNHASVGRNLIRRRISEILRINQELVVDGFDIAFFIRRDILQLDFASLQVLIIESLDKCGLIKKSQ